jgi:hypothetical protein
MKTTDKLVTVFTLSDPVKADIIKNALEEVGIRCFLDGMNQAIVPGTAPFRIHIQVQSEDEQEATAFIKEHEARTATESELED